MADLAAAHVAALSACREGQYAAYNLGTGQGVSINDVIGRAAARDPVSLITDASLVRQALNWGPFALTSTTSSNALVVPTVG